MPAPFENKNAVKPEGEKASSFLYIRALPGDKAGWVKAAARAGQNLTDWVTAVLNRAARPAGAGNPKAENRRPK